MNRNDPPPAMRETAPPGSEGGPNPALPDESPEDVAHYDDAVIGRAFRWSASLVVCLVMLGTVAWLVWQREAPAPAPVVTALAAPLIPPTREAEVPGVRFTDVTTEAGIAFVHENGAYGDKLLPETMGGGVAFFDFNNNGHQDLLFINSSRWPWQEDNQAPLPTALLYRNDGNGNFEDVTAGSGLDVPLYGMGVAVGDYNNDGWVDVFITAVGGNRLFRNEGDGRFRDVTDEAGVGGTPADWSTCAAWFDFNNDGLLDLYVGNYVRWSRDIDFEVGFSLVGIGRAYGQPNNFEGAFPYLFRNEGDGRFTDVSAESGVQVRNPATGVPMPKSLGVVPVDLDGDGWMDLVVANDTVHNLVFMNQHNGTFREIGPASGVAFDSYGNTRGAMGIDAARFRNDDRLGIVIGNFANEMTALYVSQQSPTHFLDEAITEGIGPASRLLLTFGVFFFDYDLDGWLDLLAVNGHLEEEITKIQQSQTYAQPAQLFWNAGTAGQSGFIVVPPDKVGPDLHRPIVGRGSAYADIDADGDLDVIFTQVGGPAMLLRNDQQTGNHWLRVKLVGTRSNRDAIGARVTLRSGDEQQLRMVTPTRGYLSQSELPLTFGLGSSDRVEELIITWPLGTVQRVQNPPINTMLLIEEPTGLEIARAQTAPGDLLPRTIP
jgi:enediyne biosynthesis protein E4